MREILLVNGRGIALVDDEDYERVTAFGPWYRASAMHRAGYAFTWARDDETGKKRFVYMHRFIIDAPRGRLVDHVSGDGLDNRKANLRLCTYRENNRNQIKRSRGTSQFKGVTHDRRFPRKPWRAAILLADGSRPYLGNYATEMDAARAYDAAAREHFGEFARLNFPDEGQSAAA